jgi:hypothetical protein
VSQFTLRIENLSGVNPQNNDPVYRNCAPTLLRPAASGCASSTGSSPSGKARRLRATCARERYNAVPFFWSQHCDISIDYVGHAASRDDIEQHGDVGTHDAALRFRKAGRTLAVATIFRGQESLLAELAMEKGQAP